MARKKNTSARYAFVGLIIAALACIATALLVLLKGSVALQIFKPADPDVLNRSLLLSVALIVLGLALYGILAPDKVRRFLTGRQARYSSNSVITALAFTGILIVVNLIVYQNPKTWDLTEDKQHTLAPETLQALATLPDKVTAYAFYTVRASRDTAAKLLTDLKTNSKGKFDYQFIDPEAQPLLARQYGVTGDEKIVLVMGTRSEIATYAAESELTQAMIRLISPSQRTVYFLTGHGEHDLTGNSNVALSRAKNTLETKNYIVKTLNLAAGNKIPDDAKVVIIAGPQYPLLDQEVSLLQAYLNRGGAVIALVDPQPFTSTDSASDPLAAYFKDNWGITLDNDVVIDLTSNQPLFARSDSFNPTNPITQHLRTTTTITSMLQARSLTVNSAPPPDVQSSALILTSQQSWGETDLESMKGNQQISFDQTKDIAGPLTLAASAENTKTKGRVVIFGSSTFLTDSGFDVFANGDVFVNSVDWVAGEENLIQITPRTPIQRTFIPPDQIRLIIIILGSIFVVPGLVVAAGISAWVTRRRKG